MTLDQLKEDPEFRSACLQVARQLRKVDSNELSNTKKVHSTVLDKVESLFLYITMTSGG